MLPPQQPVCDFFWGLYMLTGKMVLIRWNFHLTQYNHFIFEHCRIGNEAEERALIHSRTWHSELKSSPQEDKG